MYFGFENITIAYDKKTVLKNFSLEIPKGKSVALVGANGCGKTSLLKLISRAVSPKEGKVIFDDKDLFSYKRKEIAKRIAYLSQDHLSTPDIDVKTLVSYGRYPYTHLGRGLSKEDRAVIDRSLKITGLSELSDRPLNSLSGGERQRAWIAMAICQEPEVLILDEPTTYLDIGYQIEVLEVIKTLNKKYGITILTVLHDLNLASRYSDLIYMIKDGSLFAGGSPGDTITRENLLKVFSIEAEILEDKNNSCPYFIPSKSIK